MKIAQKQSIVWHCPKALWLGFLGLFFLALLCSLTPANAIRLETLTASRQWLTEVAELVLAKTGREFPLPEGLKGKLIRLFL